MFIFLKSGPIFNMNPQFHMLFFLNFLFFMGVNSMNILPAYLSEIGAGSGIIAFFTSTPILILVLLVLYQIIYLRSYHKMKLLRIGFVLSIIAMSGMRLFYNNITILYVFYFLTGVTYAVGFTNLFNMMYNVVSPENHRSSAAIFGISGLMTVGIASFISQWLFIHISNTSIFILPAAFHLLALIISFFIQIEDDTLFDKNVFSLEHFKSLKEIPLLIFQGLIFGGAFGIFKSFLPLITQDRLAHTDITRFYSIFTFFGICYRLIFAKWMDHVSKKTLLGFGFLMAGLSVLLLNFVSHLYQLYIIGAFYGLAHSLLFPTFSAEFVRLGGPNNGEIYNNIFIAIFTLGITTFSSSLGYMGDIFGLQVIPYFMAFFVLLGFLSLLLQGTR